MVLDNNYYYNVTQMLPKLRSTCRTEIDEESTMMTANSGDSSEIRPIHTFHWFRWRNRRVSRLAERRYLNRGFFQRNQLWSRRPNRRFPTYVSRTFSRSPQTNRVKFIVTMERKCSGNDPALAPPLHFQKDDNYSRWETMTLRTGSN